MTDTVHLEDLLGSLAGAEGRETIAVITQPDGTTPLQRLIFDRLNQFETAKAGNDEKLVASLSAEVPVLLEEWRETRGAGRPPREVSPTHENWEWAYRSMLGAWAAVRGDFAGGISLEASALELAGMRSAVESRPRARRAISLSNLCEYARRCGEYERAIAYGIEACGLWPTNKMSLITLYQALAAAGVTDGARRSQAARLLLGLIAVSDAASRTDMLAVHADHDPELLRSIRRESGRPEVAQWLGRFEEARSGG